MKTCNVKLSSLAHKLLFSATMKECIAITGSQATFYRYLKELREVYHCVVVRRDGRFMLTSVGSGNVWRGIFERL